jgi:hypothetical protein
MHSDSGNWLNECAFQLCWCQVWHHAPEDILWFHHINPGAALPEGYGGAVAPYSGKFAAPPSSGNFECSIPLNQLLFILTLASPSIGELLTPRRGFVWRRHCINSPTWQMETDGQTDRHRHSSSQADIRVKLGRPIDDFSVLRSAWERYQSHRPLKWDSTSVNAG